MQFCFCGCWFEPYTFTHYPFFPQRTSKLLATKMKWNGSDDDRIRGKKGNRSIIVLFFFVLYF